MAAIWHLIYRDEGLQVITTIRLKVKSSECNFIKADMTFTGAEATTCNLSEMSSTEQEVTEIAGLRRRYWSISMTTEQTACAEESYEANKCSLSSFLQGQEWTFMLYCVDLG